MGFFDKVFKEVTRPFKQIGREIERDFKRSILGSFLQGPEFPDPPADPLADPLPPVGIPETGGGQVTKKRRLILGGRGATILAGQLTPKVGKRILG